MTEYLKMEKIHFTRIHIDPATHERDDSATSSHFITCQVFAFIVAIA